LRNNGPAVEPTTGPRLARIGTAGFDASGGVSRRCRAEPGKRSAGAAGAEAQPATPWTPCERLLNGVTTKSSNYAMFWAIGVVTRTPKIDRES